MANAPRRFPELAQPRSSSPMLDKYAILPITACVYALIVSPLLAHFLLVGAPPGVMLESDWVSRIFWPALAMISAVLVIRNSSRLGQLWPPHILCLLMCLGLAGASVLWAF